MIRRATLALALAACAPAAAHADGTGKALYDKYCAQCHGVAGDGVGHATERVKPRPRDFTAGKYKFRTTPSGKLPTDDDLRKTIRQGLPYTSMPGWPNFSDGQVTELIEYIKSFSPAFQDPDKAAEPIDIPSPPALSEASVAKGREVFEAQGCAACHGNLGRGDGASAPSLTDDWGHHVRPADLTQRWTFRGGPTRSDIFRTFSTGVNGTPMPSYAETLAVEDRWALVDYIDSLGEGDAPGYDNLLLVQYADDELDLERADELFAEAPVARFPLVGQIVEPGRAFYPQTSSVEIQALWNRNEIAFRVRWHDMRAELAGTNSPMAEVPPDAVPGAAPAEGAGGGDFWGEEAAAEPAAAAEGDFWGEEGGAAAPAAVGGAWSDAVALQFPSELPTGVRKPYFIFGDRDRSVDLWFVDLAAPRVAQFVGRGSGNLAPAEVDEIDLRTSFEDGRWTALYKRPLRSPSNVSFQQGVYVPLSVSVWDGFDDERGNKRALSAWQYLYLQPAEQVSLVAPMVRAASLTLAVELALIFFLRRRERRAGATAVGSTAPERAGA